MALRLICPKADWSWLLTITKRIAAAAPVREKKYGQVSSAELYLLGLKLMDEATTETADQTEISEASALKYRDGMLIALLSLVAPRRRTVAALRIGKQLIKSGELWALTIPPEDVKGKRPLDYALSLGTFAIVSTYTSRSIGLAFPVLGAMMAFGLQTRERP
jgi:integrase/recombinase XerD